MKTKITLFAILLLPSLIYIYFALGVPKAFRAPFFGPRHTVEITDHNGNPKTDTAYYTIPEYKTKTVAGTDFDSKSLGGQLYIAIFVREDSMGKVLPILAEDIKTNRSTYKYARYVFLYEGKADTTAAVGGPDFASDLKLGRDTAITLYLPPAQFAKMHDAYFIADPDRKKDPWATWSDAVLIDYKGRVRGYYNIRFAAEVKKMKEDIQFINFRDKAAETIEQSTIEKKK